MSKMLFDVRIDDFDQESLDRLLVNWMKSDRGHVIVTPNAEFILEARHHPHFSDLLSQSHLALADSVSIQYAFAALSEKRLEHRYPGVDLLIHLCHLAQKHHRKLLLLGGGNGSALSARDVLVKQFPALIISSFDPGIITWNHETLSIPSDVISHINQVQPDIVAVALGQYKQEQCMFQIRDACPSVKIWIGVGGSFEMISGKKPRAPYWFRYIGLEWLWRLMIEPRRWKRIVRAVFVFPAIVLLESFRQGHIKKSIWRVFKELFYQLRRV